MPGLVGKLWLLVGGVFAPKSACKEDDSDRVFDNHFKAVSPIRGVVVRRTR